MSLENLGKVKDALKKAVGEDDPTAFLKKTLSGLDDKELGSALKILGANVDDVASAFTKIGTEGISAGTKLTDIFSGLGAVFTKLLPVLAAVGTVLATIGIVDALVDTPEELADRMNEAFSNYENAKNEVTELNTELEETNNKIADLQAKGNLSLVEKSELAKLKESAKLLEQQKRIAEEKAYTESRKAASSAIHAYRGTFIDITQENIDRYNQLLDNGMQNALTLGEFNDSSNIAAQVVALQHYKEAMDDIDSSNDMWDKYNNKVNELTGSIWEQADTLMDLRTKLESIPEADRSFVETETLSQIKDDLNYIYKNLDPSMWKQMQIDDLFAKDQFSNTKQELTELAKQYDNLTDFTNAAIKAYGDFNTALLNKGIKMSDIAENIFAEAGIIDTEAVKQQLIDSFANMDDVSAFAKGKFNNWANSLSKEDLELVYKIMLDTDEANFDLETWKNTLEEYKAMQTLDHGVEISVEQEGLEKVTTAISENASEIGLLDESINSLKSRYKALKDFDADKLFEQTANGIRLNTDELVRLEDAYATENIIKLNDALKVAAQKAKDAQIAMESNTDPEFAKAYEVRAENALDEVKAIQQLITQYNALNGAYAKAIKAAGTANGSAMRDNVKSLWDSAKELKQAGKVGTDDFQSFVELMTGKDYKGNIMDMVKDFDALNNQIKVMDDGIQKGVLSQSIGSFFVDGKQGALNFINAIKQAGKLYDGSEWVKQEDNKLSFEVDTTSLSEALGISEELVFILMENLKDYGFNIDIKQGAESIDELIEQAETLTSKLKEAGINIPPINLEINSDEIENEINKVKQWISELDSSSDTYDDSQELGKTWLKGLYAREQELSGKRYDISSVDDGSKVIAAKWNEAQDALADYNATLDTYGNTSDEARIAGEKLTNAANDFNDVAKNNNLDFQIKNTDDVENVASQLKDISSIDKIDLPVNGESVTKELDTIKITINEINSTPIVIKVNTDDALGKVAILRQQILGLNSNVLLNVDDGGSGGNTVGQVQADGIINWENNVTIPTGLTGDGIINWENNIDIPTGLTATGTINWQNGNIPSAPVASGTAYSEGTLGFAYSRGYWGIGNDGVALGGELGKELVVRDGKFFTVGDKGAEFFRHKKNDIIFNAAQTKSLFKYGGIRGANPRGKVYGSGSAFATGNAFSESSTISGSVSKDLWNWLTGGYSGGSSNNSYSSEYRVGTDEEKDFFDWIEILIDRIERAIDHFEKKVDNVFDSWESRSNALTQQSNMIREEITKQKEAYDYYTRYLDFLGLDEKYVNRIKTGEIKISEYDGDFREKIEEYQEFYEKSLDCKEAIDDLTISLSECYQTAFDNVVTQYEQLVSVVEHSKVMLDESISQSEAKGYITSTKYYDAQIAEEQKIIDKKLSERNELIKKRDEAVTSGAIVEGSEAWMDMTAEINACTEEIESANTSIIELNNSIRDTEWQIFDLLQDKISNVAKETDFLIELMSNDKLFDDKGQLTDEGQATVGLHGQNYNTYMAQADMYADEIARLNEEIEKDPYNQDLLNRRQELLELQQDNILAAESEKQAIIDLVQEGIDLELESLQKLIDKYKEALNSQKDLYDYQKQLVDQTKEIATLEKQLAAYKGNNSEEVKAKVQQIKVSLEEAKNNLEETQYERYISDQEKLLDELYAEYEDTLNERLDNVEKLFEEMISDINNNASIINDILLEKSDEVGYIISDSLRNIWNGDDGFKNVVVKYGDNFLSKFTATNNVLNTINSNIVSMVNQLNVLADTDISAVPNTDEHATGARKVSSDEVAWTQEGGKQEYIVRPSDGAILTPVAQDDDILNAQASSNIWKMANNPVDFIRSNLTSSPSVPVVKSDNKSIVQNFDKVIFSMPGITSYAEMLSEMKHDKKFEKLITAMTIGRLDGKSHLGIGKSF